MQTASLEAHGAHPGLLAVWQRQYGEDLLPIQEKAVLEGGVLRGQNVVGSGPTGSGKTFIAEMAAAHAAAGGSRAVYLVPTKALAEAKYRQFAATFGPLGIRVAISTQDRRSSDAQIARGDFDLAVTVPEKLWSLVLSAPSLAATVGALVVDEMQMVSDPERGPRLELLMGHFLNASTAQIVGLSAVLSNGREVARWLKATLVEERRRPVELRKGVYCDGLLHYREHNSGATGQEALAACLDEDFTPLQAMAALACELGRQEEATLAFVRDRRSAVQAAGMAAEQLAGEPAVAALEAIRELPNTWATAALRELLQSGVAFHTADLHFSERRVVEEAFAAGEIRCLFATSTLAVGLNLPARNVIVEPLRWQTTPHGTPTLAALSQSDFENMAGRAGRLEFGDQFGRAILMGTADFDSDMLMRRYVEARPEPVVGRYAELPPMQRLLLATALVASADSPPPALLTPSPEETADPASGAVRSLELSRSAGLTTLSPLDGSVCLTGLGRVAAATGLSMGTIVTMVAALREVGPAPANVEALIIAALSTEARSMPLPPARNHHMWLHLLEEHCREAGGWTEEARSLLWSGPLTAVEREAAARVALLVLQWSGDASSEELEERTGAHTGRALAACETVGWLVQCIARLSAELAAAQPDVSRLDAYSEGLTAALPADHLPIWRLHAPSLQRDHIISLVAAGFDSGDALAAASDQDLTGLAPRRALVELRAVCPPQSEAAAAVQTPEPAIPPDPVLVVDAGRPDIAVVLGQEVRLTDMEFRLLTLLAGTPGRCVTSDQVYNELWGIEHAVETAQIYYHRHHLCRKLMSGMPEGSDILVKTIPRRGLMLDLKAEQVAA